MMSKENDPEKGLKNDKKNLGDHVDGFSRSLSQRLRAYFLTGIVVTAPIAITIYLTWIFLNFVDTKVVSLVPPAWMESWYGETAVPGLGIVAAVLFFILVGWFATNILGKFFIRISEYFLHRMPVIRTLYGAIKQIFETIMASKSQAFREVVMLEYPRKGIWSLGFVTGTTKGEVQRTTDKETMSVFVPTTPNPTSGYLLFVPKDELTFMDMSVEEAAKLIVSAGIITPPDRQAKKTAPKTGAKKKAKKKS